MPTLEKRSDEHSHFWAKYALERGIVSQRDDFYLMPILKLKAILLAADGYNNANIANNLQISQKTIGKWRNEFSYILSRDDLPFDRIKHYFLFYYNPVDSILDGQLPRG